MPVTRRLAIVGGLAATLAPRATAQDDIRPAKLILAKSGHILTPVELFKRQVYALLDNTQLTAVSMDAAGLGPTRINQIQMTGKKAPYGSFSAPVRSTVGGMPIDIRVAMRGLGAFTRASGMPIEVLLGANLFEEMVVDLDFLAGTITFLEPREFKDPERARVFVSERKTPGEFLLPIQFGDDVHGMASVSLGYPGTILVSHPKVGEWINDGRPVWKQDFTRVFGGLSTKQDQVGFKSPPLKVGPFDLGEVEAVADVSQTEGVDATLGVMALRPFRVWLDGSRGRVWLRPNTH